MSIALIIYLAGFISYETKAIIDYNNKEIRTRVLTKKEILVIETIGNVIWPIKATYEIKDAIRTK